MREPGDMEPGERMDGQNGVEHIGVDVERVTAGYGAIRIHPLPAGYGTTLGNALRRVMLSGLPGVAITSIRLAGIYHEFSVIPNAREDTTRLRLNLKQIRFRSLNDNPDAEWRLMLAVRGEGLVTAADVRLPPDLEIVNPEQPILTLDSSDADLQMELHVQKGVGYSPAEERGKLGIGELPVDAIFSPIQRVAFQVVKLVGKKAGKDSLTLEIWTDGTISPETALRDAARMLAVHFQHIAGLGAGRPSEIERTASGIPTWVYETPLAELELSVRSRNCLKRAGLKKVGEVLDRMAHGDSEMLVIRNFGQKSLDELKQALIAKGFADYFPVA